MLITHFSICEIHQGISPWNIGIMHIVYPLVIPLSSTFLSLVILNCIVVVPGCLTSVLCNDVRGWVLKHKSDDG